MDPRRDLDRASASGEAEFGGNPGVTASAALAQERATSDRLRNETPSDRPITDAGAYYALTRHVSPATKS